MSKITFLIILSLCDWDRVLAASSMTSNNYLGSRKNIEDDGAVAVYYKDHEITEKQARESLISMKESDFATPPHCPSSVSYTHLTLPTIYSV